MNKDSLKLYRNIGFIICIAVYVFFAWHSDDAYHAYIMAKNLVEGNGFVYNVIERVNASTCPLFTLCVAAVYCICRNMFISGLAVGILFSALAIYIVLYKVAGTKQQIIFSTIALVGSTCFVTYTTAGLENSLLYFLSAVFYYIFFNKDEYSDKELFLMGLAVGLVGVTRMDAVLFFVIPVCYAYLFKRKDCSFIKCVGIGLGSLSPFIVWELFSLFYYGFFVPNTAFAKLSTDIALIEYFERGVHFLKVSCVFDVFLTIIPLVYLIGCVLHCNIKRCLSVVSMAAYVAYIIYIGGDFMVGRHLTVLYFISVFGCVFLMREYEKKDRIGVVILGGALLALGLNAVIPTAYVEQHMFSKKPGGVTDERAYYSPTTGLRSNLKGILKGDENLFIKHTWTTVDYAQFEGAKGVILDLAPGIVVYYDNKKIHMVDDYALGDPLLSKLPAVYNEYWRVGHNHRMIPEGYRESLATMTNQIKNESLKEYYDKILLIVRGELFSAERIKTIIDMNLGKYDYLLEEYQNSITMAE